MNDFVVLDYDCSSYNLSSNFTAVRKYIYYIVRYLCRLPNKWVFPQGGASISLLEVHHTRCCYELPYNFVGVCMFGFCNAWVFVCVGVGECSFCNVCTCVWVFT